MTAEPITDVTTAILETAQKLARMAKAHAALRGYLEFLACRDREAFNELIKNAREEKTPCPKK